jgi:sugar lactone lactonase YvrE
MIRGDSTGLSSPGGLAVNESGKLYVVNQGTNAITEYAPGVTGNSPPVATIVDSQPRYGVTIGIAVDGAGRVYVGTTNLPTSLDRAFNRVTVYAAGASGNVAPSAVIEGSNTGLNYPWGVAVDAAGNLYVAESWGGAVTTFPPGANGNVQPAATIVGPGWGPNVLTGLAVDTKRNVYVGDGSGKAYAFAAGATGNVLPLATIAGDKTDLNIPYSLAVDKEGRLYVANWMVNSVTVYAAGANGNVMPTLIIRGAAAGGLTSRGPH